MTDLQRARDLVTALLSELSSLCRDAPEDAALRDAEHAAQDCAASLGVDAAAMAEDVSGTEQDGVFIPPHPHVAPEESSDS